MQKHPYAKEFKKVVDKEFNALLNKGTFEYINKSKVDKQEPLPLMQVFTYKFDQDGYLIKYKARLVARGDLQYTIEDIYVATLIAQIFRAIIAIIVAFDLETHQYNVVNAFANALLPNPIACECAKGYNKPRFILRILQALYRLKILLVLWYKEFTITLENLGLYLVLGTNCLFMNNQIILIFYVDNIITTYDSKNQYQIDKFELKLINKYEIQKLGEVEHFLEVRIVRDQS